MKISIYQLKPQFQRLLAPLLQGLIRMSISPNQITLFSMSFCLLLGVALALNPQSKQLWLAFPLFMLLRMMLNAIDGMLANASQQKTPLGALLNEICDQVSDLALYLPFALAASIYTPLLLVVVIASLLAEFAGVIALQIGVARRFDGPMGKSDRAFAFGLLALLVALNVSPLWLNGVLCLVLLLLMATIFNRLQQALQQNRTLPQTQ